MSNTVYTYGADPELFAVDTNTGKFISCHDLLPGTKENPFPVEFGAVQVDGLAAEFNIEPALDFKTFKRNILAVRRQIEEMVQKEGGQHLKLVAAPIATFDQDYFDALPNSSKELGCQPDWCGMTKKANPRPDPGNRPIRTGGGHVHIGWGSGFDTGDEAHFLDCCLISQILYQSGMRLDGYWDKAVERRKLYGSPYSFRPKSFGMEYRYLSNAWVDNLEAMEFVFKVAQRVVESLDKVFVKKSNDYNYQQINLLQEGKRVAGAYPNIHNYLS